MERKEQKERIAIGFDLGTTSVGWSIVKLPNDNEGNFEILDMGVRLFDDPATSGGMSKETNVERRRKFRCNRRRLRRLNLRKSDFKKLCIKYNIVKDDDEFKKFVTEAVKDEQNKILIPVEIKVKGLTNKLTKHELVQILHNYIKHRGILNNIIDTDDKNETTNDSSLVYDSNLLPCENQLNWYKITGKVIGNAQNCNIKNDDYKKEIEKILDNQKWINNLENFKTDYLNLFSRHRHYSEGPGSSTSLSKYGRTKWNEKENKLEWLGNESKLWDKLIGKCTYYPNENRHYKKAPVTEVFNLLNNLADIRFLIDDNDDNISQEVPKICIINHEQKLDILKTENYKELTQTEIFKKLGFKKDQVCNNLAEKDKNFLENFEKLESTRKLLSWFNDDLGLKFKLLDKLGFIDYIFCKLVNYQNKQDRQNAFKELSDDELNEYGLTIEEKLKIQEIQKNDELIEKLVSSKIWSSGRSSLSAEAEWDYIEYALSVNGDTSPEYASKNQMYYFSIENTNKSQNSVFEKYKYFPENYFKDDILPSTVKRTFNQATKVLNAILKEYNEEYLVSNIIIETARELNSKTAKSNIQKEQNENKQKWDNIVKEFKLEETKINSSLKEKILLWYEQNKLDLYDGDTISLKDLKNSPDDYDIDHIIPFSISFNNSISNKVLTKKWNNNDKSNKTPFQWLKGDKFEKFQQTVNNVLDDKKSNKKEYAKFQNKVKNLLFIGDPLKYVITNFVPRQLNDTRYITRLFMQNLQDFFKQKNIDVTVSAINGALTSYARYNLPYFKNKKNDENKLIKNRDVFNHHAVDATIVTFLGLNNKLQKLIKRSYQCNQDNKENQELNDEIINELKKQNIFLSKEQKIKGENFKKQIFEFLNNENNKCVKFSRMLISKNNIQLSDETIYSLKTTKNDNGQEIKYKIKKLDLLNPTENFSKYFGDKLEEAKQESLMCFDNYKKLYDKLNDIYKKYINKTNNTIKNPFLIYKEENDQNNYLDIRPNFLSIKLDNQKNIYFVRYLKYKEKISEPFILSKHNNNACYESLNWTSVFIFKNNKNKYIPFYLTVNNSKYDSKTEKIIPDFEKLKKFLLNNNIDLTLDFDLNKVLENSILIKRGTILEDKITKQLYYVSGGSIAEKRLEIKHIDKSTKGKQIRIVINSLMNNFNFYDINILGKKYKININ